MGAVVDAPPGAGSVGPGGVVTGIGGGVGVSLGGGWIATVAIGIYVFAAQTFTESHRIDAKSGCGADTAICVSPGARDRSGDSTGCGADFGGAAGE